MAIKKEQKGFALLIAVIFMTVMLTFGLSLGSIGFKQQILASGAIASQYAFYAADAALECALYADQQLNSFAYVADLSAPAPRMACDAASNPIFANVTSHTDTQWVIESHLSLDNGTHCAKVVIWKPAAPSGKTYIFSQGYDVSCTAAFDSNTGRFVSRGLDTHY